MYLSIIDDMVDCPAGRTCHINVCDRCIECLDISPGYVCCNAGWLLNDND